MPHYALHAAHATQYGCFCTYAYLIYAVSVQCYKLPVIAIVWCHCGLLLQNEFPCLVIYCAFLSDNPEALTVVVSAPPDSNEHADHSK